MLHALFFRHIGHVHSWWWRTILRQERCCILVNLSLIKRGKRKEKTLDPPGRSFLNSQIQCSNRMVHVPEYHPSARERGSGQAAQTHFESCLHRGGSVPSPRDNAVHLLCRVLQAHVRPKWRCFWGSRQRRHSTLDSRERVSCVLG